MFSGITGTIRVVLGMLGAIVWDFFFLLEQSFWEGVKLGNGESWSAVDDG